MSFATLLRHWQGEDRYRNAERRACARLVYPPGRRPFLRIGEHRLEVLNVSECGLKFLNPDRVRFGRQAYGSIDFLCGRSVEFRGTIVWTHGNEIGVFATGIPLEIISDDIRILILGKAPGVQPAADPRG